MSKYGNRRTNGYASKKEARRAQELRLLEAANEITSLAEQMRFELIPMQTDAEGKCIERACHYIADFVYKDNRLRETVVEDAKGFKTPDYIIKRKLMLHVHGIRVREV